MNAKAIHDFAAKWSPLFSNPETSAAELLNNEEFPDACFRFGFQMDAGSAFCDKYSEEAFNDVTYLKQIVEDISNIELLGSAIFSKWRYYNHWAYSSEEINDPEARAWFVCALSRMMTLAKGEMANEMILNKVSLNSNSIGFGPIPAPDDEVEQHLTICADGRVFLSKYAFGDGFDKHRLIERVSKRIAPEKVSFILSEIAEYYVENPIRAEATDVGNWQLVMTYADGSVEKDRGSLFPMGGKLEDISDAIRLHLDMPDLLCFDGKASSDRIENIKVEYSRITKFKPTPELIPKGATWEYVTWNYSETIEIDRKTETICYLQNIAEECSVKREYHVLDGVSSFLDGFDADELFGTVEIPAPETIRDPMETTEYTITVSFLRGEPRVVKGTFDEQGLPKDFPEFAKELYDFLRFYGIGEALDPSRYGKRPRKQGDLMFCNVRFGDGGKTYCYLSNDESISNGDLVVVPVGGENSERTAVVASIEFRSPDDSPFPLEKIKTIIGRIDTPEEIDMERLHRETEPEEK